MTFFERLIHDQMYDHITKHNILNPFQSVFRPSYSTTTALLDVSDYLYDQIGRALNVTKGQSLGLCARREHESLDAILDSP